MTIALVSFAVVRTELAESTDAYATKLAEKAELNSAMFNVLTTEQQQQLQQKMAEAQAKRDARKSN